MPDKNKPPLIEGDVPDVLVNNVARIDRIAGGLARVVFYVEKKAPDGSIEHHVVANIVRPIATWDVALGLIREALADEALLAEGGKISRLDS